MLLSLIFKNNKNMRLRWAGNAVRKEKDQITKVIMLNNNYIYIQIFYVFTYFCA
jgi:hypothetical protein